MEYLTYFMLNVINPIKIKYFINLIRLNKPIGFMLLMWPCWFALAEIVQKNFQLIDHYSDINQDIFFKFSAFVHHIYVLN